MHLMVWCGLKAVSRWFFGNKHMSYLCLFRDSAHQKKKGNLKMAQQLNKPRWWHIICVYVQQIILRSFLRPHLASGGLKNVPFFIGYLVSLVFLCCILNYIVISDLKLCSAIDKINTYKTIGWHNNVGLVRDTKHLFKKFSKLRLLFRCRAYL